eukprot:comp24199_c0_seq1/m.44437 comp24199_c0_seq1/g.44437  ORF comp24199_c0_seq1/g.44437 comp24199_c0_seq1/m.44437 type:complete len:1466 (-) comp24199_c0_seq1:528-4925(-)
MAYMANDSSSALWDTTVRCYEALHTNQGLGLVAAPCAFIFIGGLPKIATGWAMLGTGEWNWMYAAKLVGTVVVLVAALADLGASIAYSLLVEPLAFYGYTVPALLAVSTCLALLLLVSAHSQARGLSYRLSVYWLVAALGCVPLLVDAVEGVKTAGTWQAHVHVYSTLVHCPATILVALLSLFAEPRAQYQRIGESSDNVCPELSAGFLSCITFDWMSRMIYDGWKTPVRQDDLWALNHDLTAECMAAKFGKEWRKEAAKKNPSLINALRRAAGGPYLVAAFFKAGQDMLSFVSPQLLKGLIAFTKNEDEPMWHGYVYAGAMFGVALLQSFLLHQYFHRCFQTGLRVRSAIVTAVYQKGLVLSNAARRESTQGEITNLMAVDAQRLMDLTTYLQVVWSGPFQIALALYFLYDCMGPAIFAGVGVMVVLLPLNAVVANFMSKLQKSLMKKKDERMVVVNETMGGIKVIKLYAWERPFLQKLMQARSSELKTLAYTMYADAGLGIMWTAAPFLVSLATFATYVLQGNVLTAEKAFVALALFNLLQFPIVMLPMVIGSLVQAGVSIGRVTKFLQADELDLESIHKAEDKNGVYVGKWGEVAVQNTTFKWDKDQPPALKNITLSLAPGSLTAVVGRVGCGKSSLCSALMGNLVKERGEVRVNGRFAYVAQQAWIQNATVRDNILFGRAYEERRYRQVVEACALQPDLAILPAGDMTEIGEKGINLSGGQKQRIAMARAVYQDCDIYVLDDPLSAVDPHVATHMFEKVLGPRGLLKDKTRLLVTHRIDCLPKCNRIVVLKDGSVSEQGTYDELKEAGGAFAAFLDEYMTEHQDQKTETGEGEGVRERKMSKEGVVEVVVAKKDTGDAKLVEEEGMEAGGITWHTLSTYLGHVGWHTVTSLVLFVTVGQAAQLLTNVWLSVWASRSASSPETVQARAFYYLGVYCALGVAYAVASLLVNFILTYGGIRASRRLHNDMLQRVMRAPMSFFDTTPLGRIVNRFSKDMYTIDQAIPESLRSWLSCLVPVFGSLVVIGLSTPLFLVTVGPLLVLYMIIQRVYVATSRQLKRLDSTSRSPIFSHFGETLSGTTTILAFGAQDRFMRTNMDRLDANAVAYYASVASNRWLAVRLELIGNLLVLFAALFAALARGKIDPAFVGLSVSYALGITQELNWVVRMTSELETNIVAVERVAEYTEVAQEAPAVIPSNRPPPSWPTQGTVAFNKYSTRYRPGLDLVLKDINCDIRPGEKVGIVGRTGAGKSSLSLALFRLIEAAQGAIVIDGINIASMGLEDLRSHLTIIPQDPVLFSGTIRSNLDPFGQYDDHALWSVLDQCHLATYVRQQELGLECVVAENGENLSVGQRQLLCLGRALLRKTKILVLDEATAAVDLETDECIQTTIREQFADCTVLTIAHRLTTIMDCDRVMVLSDGRVVEFDSPPTLLRNQSGVFYSMAKQAHLAPSQSEHHLVDLDKE